MLLERRLLVITLYCFLFLAACTQEKMPSPNQSNQPEQPTQVVPLRVSPIQSSNYSFVEIVGFLKDDGILVNRQSGNVYELVRRELESGEETIIFQTANPIILSDISPDGTKIILQEGYDEMSSRVRVIDLSGNILWDDILKATEIQWYFNPFQTSEIYIQSFREDWSYETARLDLETKTLDILDFNQTFFQWASSDEIVYLDWESAVFAPTTNLVRKNINTGAVEVVEENCFAFTIVEDVWTIFQVLEDKETREMRIHSVLRTENKEIFSYETPLRDSFSENLQVPNFSYAPNVGGLLFYEETSEASKLFLGKSNEMVDMKQPFQGALPITPQMDGKYVLIGYQNEWLLHIDTLTWQAMYV